MIPSLFDSLFNQQSGLHKTHVTPYLTVPRQDDESAVVRCEIEASPVAGKESRENFKNFGGIYILTGHKLCSGVRPVANFEPIDAQIDLDDFTKRF